MLLVIKEIFYGGEFMSVKKAYVEESVNTILHMNPSLDRDAVEKIIVREMKKRITNPNIKMDNNVTGAKEDITLVDLCKWIEDRKPIASGNATFYMQPEVLQSPTSNMLRSLKKARKDIKKQMFQYKPEDDEYQQLDLAQMNAKVVMNAEYGASGAPTSAFYTKYSPAATTLMAQSIITTMAAFFEGYVGDNQKFFHLNECIDWLNTVRKKDDKVPKWIHVPSLEITIDRIKSHFITYDTDNDFIIDNYLSRCSKDELVFIYYANNIKDFIRNHPKIQLIISDILVSLPLLEASARKIPDEYKDKFDNIEKYNKWVSNEMFLNPYDVPSIIKDKMNELVGLITQFCFIEYLTTDSIVKLNNHKRNAILLVDTDSNVINSNIFVGFILDEIFANETFSRNRMYNEMICVNILANLLDRCVIKILDFYGRCHNIGEDARKELAMKNEFMFRRLFLMKVKKRYASSIVLREGQIMVPFKTEIKGVDFIKASVTDEVTKRFTKILEDRILFPEELELHKLMVDLKKFEQEIYDDLMSGGTRFLKPQTFKEESAYKKKVTEEELDYSLGKSTDGKKAITTEASPSMSYAWMLPVFRGAMVWNELYPKEKIYSYNKVKLIKLSVTGLADLDIIKEKYPEEYKLVSEKIFNSSSREIAKSGLKVIAIPFNIKKIPNWIIDLVDIDVIVSDVIASFKSVTGAFQIGTVTMKTPNGTANIISSLISI